MLQTLEKRRNMKWYHFVKRTHSQDCSSVGANVCRKHHSLVFAAISLTNRQKRKNRKNDNKVIFSCNLKNIFPDLFKNRHKSINAELNDVYMLEKKTIILIKLKS